jgi:hypothetical protein
MGQEQFGLEVSVSNVLDALPSQMRSLFAEIIGGTDANLIAQLEAEEEPTLEERGQVEDILSGEFCRSGLRSDDEPNDRGKLIDDLLGAFLLRWPIDQ